MAFTYFHTLWDDPPVYVITAGDTLTTGVALAMACAAGRPCHMLVRATWHLPVVIDDLTRVDRWLKAHAPTARLTAMAPHPLDLEAMASRGIDAILAHTLAFVDEQIFAPRPDLEKIYDAVHIARTDAFKRHHLALGVPKLALISYATDATQPSVGLLAGQYRRLAYVNWSPQTGHFWLSAGQTGDIVAQARCGLVLSAEEGPNNATMEYLLCGVPVVTTPSVGWRDVMYDPRHVAIVEPEAAAVEAAVAHFAAHPPDPNEVRRSALAKTRVHRQRVIDWLSRIVGEDLTPRADDSLWLPQFCDKLRNGWTLEPRGDGTADARPLGEAPKPRH